LRDEKDTATELHGPIKANARQDPPKLLSPFQKMSPLMEAEQGHVMKFFVEEGMKGVEIIDKPNKYYDWDTLQ
jgi:hypothetical protein